MSFTRPSLTELITRTRADAVSRMAAEELLRRNDIEVLAQVIAGTSHTLHGFIEWLSQQLIYDTAEVEFVERWANVWGLVRKPAVGASGNVTFTGTNGIIIPAATVLSRSDGVLFTTTADATIASGTATAPVLASVPSASSNTLAAVVINLVTPIANVASAATVATGGLVNGSDIETDTSLRSRLIARVQQPPHGGAAYDYVNWALEVPGVTRAWVAPLELGLGTVTVRFMRDNDNPAIPDAGEVAAVQAYIDYRRPVTAAVTVVAPTAVPLNFTIDAFPDTTAVRAAITAELADLISREAVPGGTIFLSHIREAISLAVGETNYVMTVPSADVTNTTGNITTLGVITWL